MTDNEAVIPETLSEEEKYNILRYEQLIEALNEVVKTKLLGLSNSVEIFKDGLHSVVCL